MNLTSSSTKYMCRSIEKSGKKEMYLNILTLYRFLEIYDREVSLIYIFSDSIFDRFCAHFTFWLGNWCLPLARRTHRKNTSYERSNSSVSQESSFHFPEDWHLDNCVPTIPTFRYFFESIVMHSSIRK